MGKLIEINAAISSKTWLIARGINKNAAWEFGRSFAWGDLKRTKY
jgi:hypothetical protein